MITGKTYKYQAIVINDRGHLTDPEFLNALNEQGALVETYVCPLCGGICPTLASGWKHKEDQPMGANKLAVLLEREIQFECERFNR
jgi:hypothetical protein